MSTAPYLSLSTWIQHEAIPFALDAPDKFNTAVDQLMNQISPQVALLGLGEALHGGEDVLQLRNRLFQRLVEHHGYRSITFESSFPRGRFLNDYINGNGPATYAEVKATGFSHLFGELEPNRELIEWLRQYNADPAHTVKLRYYGFDSPTESYDTDAPHQLLYFVLDYLTSVDAASAQAFRQRIEPLLGDEATWQNPAAIMDPTQSIGLSPAATELRAATEDLLSELHVRRPGFVAASSLSAFQSAVHDATLTRQLLTYHAELARQSADRVSRLLGIRDAMMADNLAYIVQQEADRGKVFAFAHNSHLKRSVAYWQLGPETRLTWWPAGAHMATLLGARYTVIGSGVGTSAINGIAAPEADTLEAQLIAAPGPIRFVPTHAGQALPAAVIADTPVRSGSTKNPSYYPLTPESFTDFDWLVMLDSTTYSRGGPWLQGVDAEA